MNRKEKYGWSCGYEKIYGSYHADNERCLCKGKTMFKSKEDAILASLDHSHNDSVFVYSTKTGYIGLSKGLLFNLKR